MTKAEIRQSALELPPQERQELASALWQSLESEPAALPEWQVDLLEERLVECKSGKGQTWSEVRAELWPDFE